MSALSSLNASDSLAANALTMPSRVRLWIMESSASDSVDASRPRTPLSAPDAASEPSGRLRGKAPSLATVPPGNENPERDVQQTESGDEQRVSPCRRREQRDRAEKHEARPHRGYGAHRECTARHDRRPIEEEPRPGERTE